jgi:hypothetical protein
MPRHRLTTILLTALTALVLTASLALAASPRRGTYKGTTDPSGKTIAIKVDRDKNVKVNYCNYSMKAKVKPSGRFTAAHNGPGGVYVAVKGKFTDRRTAKGTITVDYLCSAQGETYTAKRK